MVHIEVTGSAEITKEFKTDAAALKFLKDLKKQLQKGLKIKIWSEGNNIINQLNFKQVNTNTTATIQTASEVTASKLIELIKRSKDLNKAKTLNSILLNKGIDMSVRGLRSEGYNETHVWTRIPEMEKYIVKKSIFYNTIVEAEADFNYAIDNPPAPYIPAPTAPPAPKAPAPKAPAEPTAPSAQYIAERATPQQVEDAAERVKDTIIQMVKNLTPTTAAAVDMEEVERIVKESEEKTFLEIEEVYKYARNKAEELRAIIENNVIKEVIYVTPNVPTGVKIEGLQHNQFKKLLEMTVALREVNLFPWITGGAGGGKTHSAKQVAEALGVNFRSLSVCAQTTAAALFGYQNAAGNYVGTSFRDCYENGGLFCLDEIDNGNANVLSALNSALSNGHASFPDGQVEMHPNFYLIATANTVGNGATKKHVGRNPIDGATKDRFTYIHWVYDPNIELKVMAKGNTEVYNRVKALRDTAEYKGLECIISPRATAGVNALVNIGWSLNNAINAAITEKLTPQEKAALSL